MKFRNLSIKWQCAITLFLIVLPFILLSFYNLNSEKQIQTKRATELAISIARNIGLQQKNSEAYTRQMLSLISKLPELRAEKLVNETLNVLYKAVLSDNPQFAVVLSALPNGDVNASAIPFKPFSVKDRKYFKDIMRTRSFSAGEFAKSRLTNRPVFHYALPVIDQRDSVKLVLIASFDLAQYQNVLSVSSLPKGSDFAFYDYSGRMLYHSKNQQKLLGKRDSPKIRNAILASTDEGSFIAEDESGKARLYGFVRINIEKDSPYMYIVVSCPLSEAFEGTYFEFYKGIALTVFVLIFSIFIFLYYKNHVYRNIEKLVAVAKKYENGDLSARTDVDYQQGEPGDLAMALDNMAEAQQKRENEKDAINKHLKILSERMEIAVNSAKLGIWEWNLITHKIYWNEQMYDIYNVDINNFKETLQDWMKHLHIDDAIRFEEELHHSIKHKKNYKTSFRIKNKQKGYKNIRCFFNIIYDLNGKAQHITGVNQDITERVFLENELSHTKEMLDSKSASLKSDLKTSLLVFNNKFDILISRLEKTDKQISVEDSDHIKHQLILWRNDITEELQQIYDRL
jgi:PAS domain-containing protein